MAGTMGPEQFRSELRSAGVDVSRETMAALQTYADLLRKWQKAINLVAGATLDDVWQRHFLDSAQLVPLLPASIARRLIEAKGGTWPEGGIAIGHGLAVPVLMALAVGAAITFIANRLRFGRYVFAIGGNPEAAQLSGVNTRKVLMLVFGLMGVLVGISACISTARLNAATNSAGTLDELYVIAAAVIGGTSLAGGVGTIAGAMLGALVMQSLQSGMVLVGVDAPLQNIVVGIVLVVAVWLDGVYRKRLS